MTPEVLIMAGGQGSRLAPLTARTPKPLLPVAGRSVVEHLLDGLRDQGVRHAYIAVHHLGACVQEVLGTGERRGVALEYVVEDRPLGTAGAVGLLPAQAHPLLVVNGDVLAALPLAELVGLHLRHDAAITAAYVDHRVRLPYGVLRVESGWIRDVAEKPEICFPVLAGFYLLAPRVVAAVPEGVPLQMTDLIADVASHDRVVPFPLPGPWLDIGTSADYARAESVVTTTGVTTTGATEAVPQRAVS